MQNYVFRISKKYHINEEMRQSNCHFSHPGICLIFQPASPFNADDGYLFVILSGEELLRVLELDPRHPDGTGLVLNKWWC